MKFHKSEIQIVFFFDFLAKVSHLPTSFDFSEKNHILLVRILESLQSLESQKILKYFLILGNHQK